MMAESHAQELKPVRTPVPERWYTRNPIHSSRQDMNGDDRKLALEGIEFLNAHYPGKVNACYECGTLMLNADMYQGIGENAGCCATTSRICGPCRRWIERTDGEQGAITCVVCKESFPEGYRVRPVRRDDGEYEGMCWKCLKVEDDDD